MTNETAKIATESKTFRLPVDVIEILQRWADETKQTPTVALANCVRVAEEDGKRFLQDSSASGCENLQDNDENVLRIGRPRGRDELANAISLLMYETQDHIGERDQILALGVARARIYKATPEYQEANKTRKIPSVYEDEKALADELSSRL